jgi:hypothetical protein
MATIDRTQLILGLIILALGTAAIIYLLTA